MASRTMSFNSDPHPERWHLGRKLTLLILLVIALALGLIILFRQKTDFPLLAFDIFADAVIGLAAGLAVRIVLQQRNWFIQGLASAALVIIGLFILGYLNNGKSGIVLPPMKFVPVNWLSQWNIPLGVPAQIESRSMNWFALIQLIMVVDISWLALRAWRRPSSRAPETSTGAPSAPARRRPRSSRTNLLPRFPTSKIQIRDSGAKSKVRRARAGSMITKSPAPSSIKPARSRNWNPLHRKPQIQLAVYEEHRCPYCLEEVKRNDSRGVVECEVCHTLHHKDCWDITGACQVPHLNT